MIETVTIRIPGTPVPKGRSRSTKTGRHYTPVATVKAEEKVRLVWELHHGNRTAYAGPVAIFVTAIFEPPQSWPKWKREAALAGEWPHTARPDLDNLIKLVKDGLNTRAFLDDSQVTNVGGCKEYGREASTSVTITFLEEPSKKMKGTKNDRNTNSSSRS
jgi:Holliday junction resolvase RusA-like endonuclease